MHGALGPINYSSVSDNSTLQVEVDLTQNQIAQVILMFTVSGPTDWGLLLNGIAGSWIGNPSGKVSPSSGNASTYVVTSLFCSLSSGSYTVVANPLNAQNKFMLVRVIGGN